MKYFQYGFACRLNKIPDENGIFKKEKNINLYEIWNYLCHIWNKLWRRERGKSFDRYLITWGTRWIQSGALHLTHILNICNHKLGQLKKLLHQAFIHSTLNSFSGRCKPEAVLIRPLCLSNLRNSSIYKLMTYSLYLCYCLLEP